MLICPTTHSLYLLMIAKLLKLQNVGLFQNATASSGVSKAVNLGKITIFYAPNGRGKSTFAAVLRSLATDDPSVILERMTLGGTDTPVVKFLIGNTPYEFTNGAWSRSHPGILVFDTHFVDTNVYGGPAVTIEHRRSLLDFAIGDVGVTLTERIRTLTEKVKDLATKISTSETIVKSRIAGDLSVDQFLKLEQGSSINTIAEQQRLVEALRKQTRIAEAPILKTVNIRVPELAEAQTLLATTVEVLSAAAEVAVMQHNARVLGGTGEDWLQTGVRYASQEACPFCGQPMSGVELLQAYQGFFSTEYHSLKDRIRNYRAECAKLLEDYHLRGFIRCESENEQVAAFWSEHMEVDLPASPVVPLETAWITWRAALLGALDQKALAPLEDVSGAAELIEAGNHMTEAFAAVEEFNRSVVKHNEQIVRFKEYLGQHDLRASERDLLLAQNGLVRHGDTVRVECETLENVREDKLKLEAEKAQAKNDLQFYTETVLAEYQRGINRYLDRCGAGFRIEQVKPQYSGGVASGEYMLNILNTSIKVSDRPVKNQSATFRTALSDGDKRTLAFAFFITRLESEQGLSDKVVVFDDPLVSFDAHRRHVCTNELRSISSRAKQTIILTHDLGFAKAFYDAVNEDAMTYKLRRAGNYTVFESCDINVESQDVYLRSYSRLRDFLESGPTCLLIDVGRSIRPLVEHCLRSSFPSNFASSEESLGKMIATIRTCDNASPLHSVHCELKRLTDINDYVIQFNHDAAVPGADDIEESELRVFVQLALDFVHRIP